MPAAAAVLGCIALAFAINAFLVAKVESNLGVQLSLPPFMTGRVIDDVSGRKYIEAGCVPQQFEICRFADRIAKRPKDAGGALTWIREAENGGVYLVENLETRTKLRAENLAFAEAAVRAYPFTQIYRSLRNFARLLVSYRLNIGSSQLDYTYSDYATAVGWPGAALILQYGPGTEECAVTPKQNCGRVQLNKFLIPHHLTLLLAAGVLAWYGYLHIKAHGLRFSNLGAVEFAIVFFVGAIVANALVCGVLWRASRALSNAYGLAHTGAGRRLLAVRSSSRIFKAPRGRLRSSGPRSCCAGRRACKQPHSENFT